MTEDDNAGGSQALGLAGFEKGGRGWAKFSVQKRKDMIHVSHDIILSMGPLKTRIERRGHSLLLNTLRGMSLSSSKLSAASPAG